MALETTGRIHAIFDAKQVTERFRKRELVLELADGRRPQYVQFELTGDRCDRLDAFRIGDEVRVEFSLRGREWRSPKGEVRYFNSLDVWTIEPMGAARSAAGGEELFEGVPPPGDDDIPF